jgi:hypothetical protein
LWNLPCEGPKFRREEILSQGKTTTAIPPDDEFEIIDQILNVCDSAGGEVNRNRPQECSFLSWLRD